MCRTSFVREAPGGPGADADKVSLPAMETILDNLNSNGVSALAVLRASWANIEGMRRFHRAVQAIGPARLRPVANRVINRTGDMARTQVRRTLSAQTGLKRKTIVKAVKTSRSNVATLAYSMSAKGGDVALKYFGARETRRGVSAAPWGKRQIFAGSFIMGGRFPGRVPLNLGGHVFERVGSGRVPIEKPDSGVIIPAEMVKGETARAFQTTVATVMPMRMAHEIRRLTGGVIS